MLFACYTGLLKSVPSNELWTVGMDDTQFPACRRNCNLQKVVTVCVFRLVGRVIAELQWFTSSGKEGRQSAVAVDLVGQASCNILAVSERHWCLCVHDLLRCFSVFHLIDY